MIIDSTILGATTNRMITLLPCNDYKENHNIFFKNLTLREDFFIKIAADTCSLIWQPIAIVCFFATSLFCFTIALLSCLKIITDEKNFIDIFLEENKSALTIAKDFLLFATTCILGLILSPLGNLISLIGSMIITAAPSLKNPEDKLISLLKPSLG